MNDYERRVELLNQTKGTSAPSFHPMNREPVSQPKSSLGVRITICILCFICYVLFDYSDLKVSNIDTQTVVHQIGKQMSIENILE